MAANKSQGSYFGLFLVGSTVLCAGFAYYEGGLGKALLALGAILLVGSLFGFMGIKSLEGVTAMKPSPTGMKLGGAAVALLGWVLTLLGIHLTTSVGGRMVFALLGIAVSLVGILYILPAAFNKNAVWKGTSSTPERAGFSGAAKTTTEHI